MSYIITEKDKVKNMCIGGKAKNLFHLKEMGLNVPKFIVIPYESLDSLTLKIPGNSNNIITDAYIPEVSIPEPVIENIIAQFPGTTYFAVRSSAIDEDGTHFSFAGQFVSFLFITKENLAEKIKAVWRSAFSKRVSDYRRNNNLEHKAGIAVIIQEMIDADAAGVAFGLNPVTGNTNEKFISSVFGLGEGIVSGELNADNFTVNNGEITSAPAVKTHKLVFDHESGVGIKKIMIEDGKQLLLSLNDKTILELSLILDTLYKEYGKSQDVEFAVKNEKLFLLQTRPVTTTSQFNTQKNEYTVWDNSNIIESYPGVTTPLTFSFISKSYEGAYKLFCRYMGVSQKVIDQNEKVFSNTLGLINGRVYYNLKTWYHMLAMLPGYSINARYMEKMMGVKERFDIPENYRLSKGKAWRDILKMAVNMYARFISLPRKRREFNNLLNTTITHYKGINLGDKTANELMGLYIEFEKTLLNEWKAPLLNDFFAMIWFGMLQKRCEKYHISKNPNIHNDLLCGSSDIISTQPIHRTIELASIISSDTELKDLFISESENTIIEKLATAETPKFISLKRKIDSYITDFGERCIGELKLETVSFTQDPSKFIKILRSYVVNEITLEKTSGKIEDTIRANAEQQVKEALKYSPYKKWKLNRTLKKARELVSARENLRYERTRAFGIVREIFSHIGNKFHSERIIESSRDIFYLTLQEIFSYIDGTSVTQNIKALITLRKSEFNNYQAQEPPSERFSTYGMVYHSNDFYSKNKSEINEGGIKGIGCCPGRVKGKVKVILHPGEVSSLDGDILVTSSTDPGWVTLFPSASGIIVERGSVLSHSAIVSREMGKPCIVSVTGLLKTLKTGDEIEMDGSTGEIKIIKKA